MTNNEKIARWAGTKCICNLTYKYHEDYCALHVVPDYENSDAAAVTLLPVLAEKGYWFDMHMATRNTQVQVNIHHYYCEDARLDKCAAIAMKPSISAAISSAILQLIESEASNEL